MKKPVNTVTIAIDGIGELTNEFRQQRAILVADDGNYNCSCTITHISVIVVMPWRAPKRRKVGLTLATAEISNGESTMEFRNFSSHPEVAVAINSALPIGPPTVVARLGMVGKGVTKSAELPQGPNYYVYISASNVEPIPAGSDIGLMGGVLAGSTVTLTANDTIIIS